MKKLCLNKFTVPTLLCLVAGYVYLFSPTTPSERAVEVLKREAPVFVFSPSEKATPRNPSPVHSFKERLMGLLQRFGEENELRISDRLRRLFADHPQASSAWLKGNIPRLLSQPEEQSYLLVQAAAMELRDFENVVTALLKHRLPHGSTSLHGGPNDRLFRLQAFSLEQAVQSKSPNLSQANTFFIAKNAAQHEDLLVVQAALGWIAEFSKDPDRLLRYVLSRRTAIERKWLESAT